MIGARVRQAPQPGGMDNFFTLGILIIGIALEVQGGLVRKGWISVAYLDVG